MAALRPTPSLDELCDRARGLCASGNRAILGIAGAPGSGKTTLAEALVARLASESPSRGSAGAWVAHLPMDGFHLADVQLERLGLRARKGAPETFDAEGYAAMLARVRGAAGVSTVYAPGFERVLEQPIAAAVAIEPSVRLVVTEGNYLLMPDQPWPQVRALLDEAWSVETDPAGRVERLIARHVQFGKTPQAARAWVMKSDEANTALIAAASPAADLRITLA